MRKIIMTTLAAATFAATVYAADAVATVNGMPITKDEIKQVLQMIDPTGKTEWDKLDKAKKEEIIRMIAPSKVMAQRAKKELSEEEKDTALASYWMQKKLQETQVTQQELKEAYDKIKASYAKQAGGDAKKAQQFPPFEMLKPQIEMKVKQDKLLEGLLKDANIEMK